MERTCFRWLLIVPVLIAFSAWQVIPEAWAREGLPEEAQAFLSVGKPGPKAIDLKIKTDKPEGYTFRPGDTMTLQLKASSKGYLTIIYLSARGDVIVLFPNAQNPNNVIMPGKDYMLFGPNSGIKLTVSDKMKEGQIVFYISSEPVNLDPLKIPEGQPCIRIPASSAKERDILRQKLEAMAKDQGFNRVAMTLKSGSKEGLSLNLMGLPTSVKSERPQPITGVQGAKPEKIQE